MALLPIISLRTTPATVHFSHHDVIGGLGDSTTQEITRSVEKSSPSTSQSIRAEDKIVKSILRPSRYKTNVQHFKKPLNAPLPFDPHATSSRNTIVSPQESANWQDDFQLQNIIRHNGNKRQIRKKEKFQRFSSKSSSLLSQRHQTQEKDNHHSLHASNSMSVRTIKKISLETSKIPPEHNLQRKTLQENQNSDSSPTFKTKKLPDIATRMKRLIYSCSTMQPAASCSQGDTNLPTMQDNLDKAFQAFHNRIISQNRQDKCAIQHSTVSPPGVNPCPPVQPLFPFIGAQLSSLHDAISPTDAPALVPLEVPVLSLEQNSSFSLANSDISTASPHVPNDVSTKTPITTPLKPQTPVMEVPIIMPPTMAATVRSITYSKRVIPPFQLSDNVRPPSNAPIVSTPAAAAPLSPLAPEYRVQPRISVPTVPLKTASVPSAPNQVSISYDACR